MQIGCDDLAFIQDCFIFSGYIDLHGISDSHVVRLIPFDHIQMFKSGYNIIVAWVAGDDPYIVETRRYLSPLFAGSQFVQPDAIVLEVARSGNTPFAAGQFGRKTGERVPLPLIFDCPVVHQSPLYPEGTRGIPASSVSNPAVATARFSDGEKRQVASHAARALARRSKRFSGAAYKTRHRRFFSLLSYRIHQVAFSRTARKFCTDFGGAPRENK